MLKVLIYLGFSRQVVKKSVENLLALGKNKSMQYSESYIF